MVAWTEPEPEPGPVSFTLSASSLVVAESGESNSAEFTVVLDAEPADDWTLTIANSDSSVMTVSATQLIFTTFAWDTPQTVRVTATDDDFDNAGNQRSAVVTVSGSDGVSESVSVQVDDEDVRGLTLSNYGAAVNESSTTSHLVWLNSAPTGGDTVTVTGKHFAGEILTLSPATLAFTAGNWNLPQEVVLIAALDSAGSSSALVQVSYTASGADYDADQPSKRLQAILWPADHVLPSMTVSQPSLTVNEAAGDANSAEFTLVLDNEPTATVTVSLFSDDPDAVATSPSELEFTEENWNVPQTVTVVGVDDAVDNDADMRTANVHVVAARGGYYGVTAQVPVQIGDDDTRGLELSSTQIEVRDGSSDSYTVALDSAPAYGKVTVTITNPAGALFILSSTTLEFTADNWDVPQTVTATAVDNLDTGGNDVNIVMPHRASGADYDTDPGILIRINVRVVAPE